MFLARLIEYGFYVNRDQSRTVTNSLAYYGVELLTDVKSFIPYKYAFSFCLAANI
jgi:hypothetical protein